MKKLTKKRKEEFVEMLTDEIKGNNINLLVSFSGLSVPEMQQLRDRLRESGCRMMVVKNTLLEKAYKNMSYDEMCKGITGPIFVIWSKDSDEIGVVKNLFNFKKDAGKIDIRAGMVGKRFFSSEELEVLGKLPVRKELEAKVVWSLKVSFLRITGALRYPVTRLIQDFKQIAEIKK
jgi:large subunit ribosomal protein L10